MAERGKGKKRWRGVMEVDTDTEDTTYIIGIGGNVGTILVNFLSSHTHLYPKEHPLIYLSYHLVSVSASHAEVIILDPLNPTSIVQASNKKPPFATNWEMYIGLMGTLVI